MRFTTLRFVLPVLALITGLALLSSAPAADTDKKDGFTPLFNGRDLTGWKVQLARAADPAKTFQVKDGVIIVTGKPAGYFYTDKGFKNYVLRYDWRYQRPDGLQDDKTFRGNSGLLVHIQPPHKVWPRSIEVQGMNLDHGRILNVSGAKGKYTLDKAAQAKAIKPVGEWNTTEVTCKDGDLSAKINGVPVSSGTGDPKEGPIGFQSEGAEIHFRNIEIKEMK